MKSFVRPFPDDASFGRHDSGGHRAFQAEGFPIAMTGSPTCSLSESPKATLGRFWASIFRSARSVFGSRPTTFAGKWRPPESLTVISVAPSTTWLLVTM